MATNKIIVAGDVKEGVEEWLQEHGARIEHCLGLTIAELPQRAHVEKDRPHRTWHITVSFSDKDGTEEAT